MNLEDLKPVTLADMPAPFLGGPLTGRETKRNLDSAAIAFARMRGFGYIPLVSPDGSPDAGSFVNSEGKTVTRWFGYPGTEHHTVVFCLGCNTVVSGYYSHFKRGSSHDGCTLRGRKAREAFMVALTGAPIVMPDTQPQPNGATVKAEQPPAAVEAAEAEESAVQVRTEAAADAAESRPAPEPEAQPPKSATVRPLGSAQWRALDGMLHTSASFASLAAGEWDSEPVAWHQGSVSRTLAVFESLERSGHVSRAGTRYTITEQGRAAHEAGAAPQTAPPVAAAPQPESAFAGTLRELLSFD